MSASQTSPLVSSEVETRPDKGLSTALEANGVRADFPGLFTANGKPWHYLDTAASSQKPQKVIDAMSRALGADYATVHRGVYGRSAQMTLGYEAARRRVADFIGADSEDEVVFVRGATEGINLVAQSWGMANLREGDRIVLSMLEHHSNIVPWQMIAERTGAVIDVCPLTEDGRIDLGALEDILTPRTKIVSLAHVSNVLGSVLDARAAADLAHSVGAKLLLDGCQSAPRMALDMTALGCDFYVFSGHKLYGPTGIGVLWGRKDLLEDMPPWQGGGAMIEKVEFARSTYAPPPQRFEAGTPMITEAISRAGEDAARGIAPAQFGQAVRAGGKRGNRLFRHRRGSPARSRHHIGRRRRRDPGWTSLRAAPDGASGRTRHRAGQFRPLFRR